jgi:hypothetical protein
MAISMTRPGQVNGSTSDNTALLIEKYSTEALAAFQAASVTDGRQFSVSIENGKSYSFPTLGYSDAEILVPGAEIEGVGMNFNEKVITIDGELASHDWVANIDEKMVNYNLRSELANSHGRAVAKKLDINTLKELIKGGSQSSHPVTGMSVNTAIADNNFRFDSTGTLKEADRAKYLCQGIYNAAEALDNQGIPDSDRIFFFRPKEYYSLFNNTDVLNREFGGVGRISEGDGLRIAGFDIFRTPNIPKDNSTSTDALHGVDATKIVGIAYWKNSVGTLKLMDLNVSADWVPARRATLLVTALMAGHAWLRPEGIQLLTVSTGTYTTAS